MLHISLTEEFDNFERENMEGNFGETIIECSLELFMTDHITSKRSSKSHNRQIE